MLGVDKFNTGPNPYFGKACKPRLAGAVFGLLSPVWSALLHNGMTLGVLLNSIAGVSLKTGHLEALQDRLETLKVAYRGGRAD